MENENTILTNTELIRLSNKSEMFMTDIKRSNLLPQESMERLNELAPELNHNFETQTIWRTETEIRTSVLNALNFPDNASKYHQCKLEQLVFAEQLLHLSFEYDKAKEDLSIKEAEIEELDEKISESTKNWEIKKLTAEKNKKTIEMKQLVYTIQHYQTEARERLREIEIWSKIKHECDDGTFDIDKKNTNQLISITRRYVQEAFHAINHGKNSDICSYNNIVAQFDTMTRACVANGLFEEMISYFGQDMRQWVIQILNLNINQQPVSPLSFGFGNK